MSTFYPLTLQNTAYLWFALMIFPLWLYGFIKNKDSRQEMILCGILFGVMSIVLGYLYANKDYWNPPYIFNNVLHIEDFLYGFLFGGVASEIYEILFPVKSIRKSRKIRIGLIILFIIITIFCFLFLVNYLKVNSIIAHIVSPLLVGVICVIYRKDFLFPALISGVILLFITYFWYKIFLLIYPTAIIDTWKLENLSGIFIDGIPLEEFLFAFGLGFGASCFYEAIRDYKYVRLIREKTDF